MIRRKRRNHSAAFTDVLKTHPIAIRMDVAVVDSTTCSSTDCGAAYRTRASASEGLTDVRGILDTRSWPRRFLFERETGRVLPLDGGLSACPMVRRPGPWPQLKQGSHGRAGALAAIAAAVEDVLKPLRVQSNEPPLTPTRSGEFREAGRMRQPVRRDGLRGCGRRKIERPKVRDPMRGRRRALRIS